MAIPEAQLDTWSGQGAIATSSACYASVRAALSAATSRIAALDTDVYLQGSYRNATNIYGDSDVDIVVQLKSVFQSDVSALDETQKAIQQTAFADATYRWPNFRADVLQTLQARRTETQRRNMLARLAWERSGQPKISDETYRRGIQPRLASVTIPTIMSALNVCASYAADIRRGKRRPHARHWETLAQLVGCP